MKITINVEVDTNDEKDSRSIEELIEILTDLKQKIDYYEDQL